MTEHVLVWDLETAPDLNAAARVYGLPATSVDKIREALGTEFPRLPLHGIVCIGALIASGGPEGWLVESLGAPHIGDRPERDLISAFIERIGSSKPQLVTYNGGTFDLPVLRYRAMLHRIAADGLFVRNYFGRFSEDAIDLCDVLASFDSRAKVSLDLVCKVLGFAGKPSSISGADIARYVASGRVQEVADYCETDVVNTYRLWLLFQLFRRELSRQAWELSERNLQEFVASKLATKPHLRRIAETVNFP